ncbi:sarcosine oxidase subunit gamma [Maritalea myrionectae]|uniref:sarcosine oxidase subunit gamma n=1 Tax=Maritalea myrionectae TaxID=454601 RepID=UPI0004068FAB|nr:sarcosine oxidase subunit gamma family protein [Maritalea myrionectae]
MSSDATNSTLEMDQGVTMGQSLDHPGQSFTVELMGEKSRFSLRLRESNVAAFAKATGLALPTKINTVYRDDDALIMCLAPDEWLIIAAPEVGATLQEKCKRHTASPFSLVDVSHRNVAFHIGGEGAAQLINVGCPLDLDLATFPVGKCTRTIFERAEIVLFRETETIFHIEIWRSFAPYFLSVLSNGGQAQ